MAGESGYLQLMRDIIETGWDKPTRTSVGTRYLVGRQLVFDLSEVKQGSYEKIIPLLTTKKVSFRLILSELLWFLKASCDSNVLSREYNNHIWDGNGSRAYLDKVGLVSRVEGQLGPIYGWQWRRWNKRYPTPLDLSVDSSAGSIDQIAAVIDGIKKDPWGRRHIVTAWNPEQLSEMALPPCHMMFQFVVRPYRRSSAYHNIEDPKKRFELSAAEIQNAKPFWLDCIMIQRSADVPLGVPFNIVSYAVLTHMIASLTGLIAGQLTVQMNDVHIYHNQIDGCLEQLKRPIGTFPKLKMVQKPSIDEFDMSDFELVDYNPQPAITFPMSL